jgi:hypothetical protein
MEMVVPRGSSLLGEFVCPCLSNWLLSLSLKQSVCLSQRPRSFPVHYLLVIFVCLFCDHARVTSKTNRAGPNFDAQNWHLAACRAFIPIYPVRSFLFSSSPVASQAN